MNSLYRTVAGIAAILMWIPLPTLAADQPATLGWIERVRIDQTDLLMHAKIDTGADNSSINAHDVQLEKRDGQTLVRFLLRDRHGTEHVMERPLVRMAHIKRKEGGTLQRPVVTLALCIAGQSVEATFNLADRNHFRYQVLIGRSLLSGRFLVDSGHTYTTRPDCPAKP